jgi:citrate lyase subunit beta / citryl-CoA lyase
MTPSPVRLRRTVLFTPGTRGDRIEKAIDTNAADVVVADLEDAVPPEEKADARRIVHDALSASKDAVDEEDAAGAIPERCVRINTWRSGWAMADLEAALPARPDVIVLPKAGPVADLIALDLTLRRLERREGLPIGATRVLPILETAHGVLEAQAVAMQPRVVAVAFGAEDLAADAGLKRSPSSDEVFAARSHVALAAAAAGVDAIDQVFVDIEDTERLIDEARFARSLGYRGKMVIHPRQVASVEAAFSPTNEEVEHAKRLVDAVDGADVGKGGVLRFEGRMIDVPLIEQARRVLVEAAAPRRG